MRTTAALIDIEAVPTIARKPTLTGAAIGAIITIHCIAVVAGFAFIGLNNPVTTARTTSSDTLAAAIAHAAALSVGTAFSNRIAIVASFTIGRIYMTLTALWDHASDTLATRVADRTTAGITT